MCGHDHNKQLIMMEIENNNLPLIVCGTGGKVYDDINYLDCLDKKSELEFFSNKISLNGLIIFHLIFFIYSPNQKILSSQFITLQIYSL